MPKHKSQKCWTCPKSLHIALGQVGKFQEICATCKIIEGGRSRNWTPEKTAEYFAYPLPTVKRIYKKLAALQLDQQWQAAMDRLTYAQKYRLAELNVKASYLTLTSDEEAERKKLSRNFPR